MNKPTISSIFSELSKLDDDSFPPVDKWDPPLCDNVEMRIDRSGRWFFMNSPIGRERMVNLFSRVLRLDPDGFYYLVTPVEKIKIIVEDKPFIIIDYELVNPGVDQIINFKTNTQETFSLNAEHPLRVEVNKETSEPSPYVLVRKNLEALISRNVYYKLIDLGEDQGADFGVKSKQLFFKLY
tara:strand:+ start:139 stop:684 length:546 start_codon:yes stop_codon:yes gene_type:complete